MDKVLKDVFDLSSNVDLKGQIIVSAPYRSKVEYSRGSLQTRSCALQKKENSTEH